MKQRNRSHLHSLIDVNAGEHVSRAGQAWAPRLRPQLVADAVVAGYIHDISTRHRAGAFEGYDLSLRETYDLTPEAEAA